MAGNKLERVFSGYSGEGKGMDGKTFAKLAKDCELLDGKLSATEVDITFEKIKERSERRINFDQFRNGLSLLAKKKGLKLPSVITKVEKLKGPILHGTVAEPNKFHDDKTLYTGVHANGGPSIFEEDRVSDLAFLLDRSPADVRGVKRDGKGTRKTSDDKQAPKNCPVTAPLPDTHKLRDLFHGYCKENNRTMGSEGFTKVAREHHLLDNAFTATDVNLIFVQIKDRDAQEITYEQFLDGLAMCAETKGTDRSQVEFALTGQHSEPRDRVVSPCADSRQLREVFGEYCGDKDKRLDGRGFAKLIRDCDLVDKQLAASEVDLVFMRVKDTQEKRISYEQFLLGLAHVAHRKGLSNADIGLTVSRSKGPILKGTRAEPNRFYDDRTSAGLKASVDLLKISEPRHRPEMVTETAPRGSSDSSEPSAQAVRASESPRRERPGGASASASLDKTCSSLSSLPPCVRASGALARVFGLFSSGGRMESRDFAKVAKDCKVLGGKLTAQEVDLIFYRIKDRDDKAICYEQFRLGLALMAERKGVATLGIEEAVAQSEGPVLRGTRAEPNRFYDDRRQNKAGASLSGVLKACTSCSGVLHPAHDHVGAGASDLSASLERADSGPKGRHAGPGGNLNLTLTRAASEPVPAQPAKQVQLAAEHMKEGPGSFGRNGGGILRNAGMRMVGLEEVRLPRGAAVDSRELQRVFSEFAQGTLTMDAEHFAALVRETKLTDPRLTPKTVDAIFDRFARNAPDHRISYAPFLEALAALALEKGIHVEAVVARMEWASAPPTVLTEENTLRNKEPRAAPDKKKKRK